MALTSEILTNAHRYVHQYRGLPKAVERKKLSHGI
jgi:hypothetical protein